MKIFYIHGFGSSFDETSAKITTLKTLGEVSGVDIDYTKSFSDIKKLLIEKIIESKADLIVGTSMGGYYAAELGNELGVPFVAINPAITPYISLQKYVGNGVDWTGKSYSLKKKTVDEYHDISTTGAGLILLDNGDDVIDSTKTFETLKDKYSVKCFEGGSHRFEHMNESLDLIKCFYDMASVSYGF